MASDPTADSDIEASAEAVETLTTTLATAIIESETEWLSFGSSKICRQIFGNARLPMHEYYPKNPWLTLKLWLSSTAGLYLATMTRRKYQALPNPIMSLTALENFCAIIYFSKHPPDTQGLGFHHILCAPVNYEQPSYATTVYGTTNPALATNSPREYCMASCFDKYPCTHLYFYINSTGACDMGDWNRMLLASATVPLPLKEAITIDLGLRYAENIFAVGSHTSEHNPMLDILPPLAQTPAYVTTVSSQILLPRVFPLVSHGDVLAEVILLVKDSNNITTKEQLSLWSAANASGNHFSHSLNETFSSPTFSLWVETIRTDSTLFEAATADFLSKDHHIQTDCYASLLVASHIGINVIKFYISNPEKMIEDARNNQAPFPSPITLYRDITSYNLPVSWGQGRFKYIKVPIMKAHLSQLTGIYLSLPQPLKIAHLHWSLPI